MPRSASAYPSHDCCAPCCAHAALRHPRRSLAQVFHALLDPHSADVDAPLDGADELRDGSARWSSSWAVKHSADGNQIGDAGCKALAGAFSKQGVLPTCEKLDLSDNKIGDEGFAALAAALDAGALPKCKARSKTRTRAAVAPLHAAAALTALAWACCR